MVNAAIAGSGTSSQRRAARIEDDIKLTSRTRCEASDTSACEFSRTRKAGRDGSQFCFGLFPEGPRWEMSYWMALPACGASMPDMGMRASFEAAAQQMRQLPYATGYFHYASEPAIRLAAKLADLAPGDLNRIFFTLGGSDAVDTIIRYVRYFYSVQGKASKKHFIALDKGFHGSSSNGSGLTALPVFHSGFDVPMPWQHHIPSPFPYRHEVGDDADAIISASIRAFHQKVDELGQSNVAAFICELVQGSGGVIVPPKGFASAMQQACRERDVLFIVDEVITGFGRTGPMFACEHEGIEPDLMSVQKA